MMGMLPLFLAFVAEGPPAAGGIGAGPAGSFAGSLMRTLPERITRGKPDTRIRAAISGG
jgi:hypothetical protein